MFTGIVQETGTIRSIRSAGGGIRLELSARLTARDAAIGDSLAVNGCCLTIVQKCRLGRQFILAFDLLLETWQRASFPDLRPGGLVNLERSLRADGRLDGHFVTGHIDGVGTIARLDQRGADRFLRIKTPQEILRYVVFKGSIAVDGISLTVAGVQKDSFSVWIIPHTWEVTALRDKQIGSRLNLEADILGKYVEKFVQLKRPTSKKR